MNTPSAEALAARLGDRSRALSVRDFPVGHLEVGTAGLYAWWTDDAGAAALTTTFESPIAGLIYAGQAGASSSRTGVERSAPLSSRIKGNHLGGNIGSSTLRKTLTASLALTLGLTLARPGRLDRESNQLVSSWMRDHLSIVTVSCPDRSTLAQLEDEVPAILDPPLNLQENVRQTCEATAPRTEEGDQSVTAPRPALYPFGAISTARPPRGTAGLSAPDLTVPYDRMVRLTRADRIGAWRGRLLMLNLPQLERGRRRAARAHTRLDSDGTVLDPPYGDGGRRRRPTGRPQGRISRCR